MSFWRRNSNFKDYNFYNNNDVKIQTQKYKVFSLTEKTSCLQRKITLQPEFGVAMAQG